MIKEWYLVFPLRLSNDMALAHSLLPLPVLERSIRGIKGKDHKDWGNNNLLEKAMR